MVAVKRILRYVSSSKLLGLTISSSRSSTLWAFADADCGGNPYGRRSTGGFAVFFSCSLYLGVLASKLSYHVHVSRSSTEGEYKSLGSATVEVIWIQSLLKKLKVPQPKASIL